jgi:ABC-2 type transport system permease protein
MMSSPLMLFIRSVIARAYPRWAGIRRQPSWIFHEAMLPILTVASFAYIYRAMNAPEEFIGFVILGGAMTTFWMNVLWSMGAQLYWERSSGNLELFIMSPTSMMSLLGGMALGGMTLTFIRATVIFTSGVLMFNVTFAPSNWGLLLLTFTITLIALYGMGMMFASLFLLWGREAWHLVNLLQEPVYFLSGANFPLKVLPSAAVAVAGVIPLTLGLDAMRQLLFNIEGLWSLEGELATLLVLSVVFVYLAKRFLNYLERKARETGRITVKWQ